MLCANTHLSSVVLLTKEEYAIRTTQHASLPPMRFNTRSHPASSSRTRTALRCSSNRRFRLSSRRALHRGFRQIIPFCGPEFHQACVALERVLKQAESLFEQSDPGWRKARFQPICTPEEADRIAEENLKRAYGKEAIAARQAAQSKERLSPTALASKPQSQTPSPTSPPPTPTPAQVQKPDIIQVPLPRLPDDYSSSLPAPSNRLESLLFSLFGRA